MAVTEDRSVLKALEGHSVVISGQCVVDKTYLLKQNLLVLNCLV